MNRLADCLDVEKIKFSAHVAQIFDERLTITADLGYNTKINLVYLIGCNGCLNSASLPDNCNIAAAS